MCNFLQEVKSDQSLFHSLNLQNIEEIVSDRISSSVSSSCLKAVFGYPYLAEVAMDPGWQSCLRQNSAFFRTRCQAKFLTCNVSDFTPCAHAQSNIPYTKYAEKTDC